MFEENAYIDKDKFALALSTRFYQRCIASYLYYTGLIESESARLGRPTWSILRYQRVTIPEQRAYPVPLNRYVRPKTFAMQMKYLAKYCNVLPLDSLVELLEQKRPVPPRSVVVTLDEGWADNFAYALPILRQFNIPATIFLPTEFIGSMNLFWPDKVMASLIFLFDKKLSISSLPFVAEHFPELKSAMPEDATQTMLKAEAIVNRLKQMPPPVVAQILAFLGTVVGDHGGLPVEREFLTWDEVQEMSRYGITFGSLGTSGRLVAELSVEDLASDLRQSSLKLKEMNVPATPVFALPLGLFSRQNRKDLQQLGSKYCLGIGETFIDSKNSVSHILGRIPMFEAVSYCPECFACRVWGITYGGVIF